LKVNQEQCIEEKHPFIYEFSFYKYNPQIIDAAFYEVRAWGALVSSGFHSKK